MSDRNEAQTGEMQEGDVLAALDEGIRLAEGGRRWTGTHKNFGHFRFKLGARGGRKAPPGRKVFVDLTPTPVRYQILPGASG